jgi:hypothetical protein
MIIRTRPRNITPDEKIDLGIKAVRECGKTNMFDKSAVAYWAFQMGFFETVTFVSEASGKDYIQRLNNLVLVNLPDIDATELLDLHDNCKAREVIVEYYFF